jgi:hypothetical protein
VRIKPLYSTISQIFIYGYRVGCSYCAIEPIKMYFTVIASPLSVCLADFALLATRYPYSSILRATLHTLPPYAHMSNISIYYYINKQDETSARMIMYSTVLYYKHIIITIYKYVYM